MRYDDAVASLFQVPLDRFVTERKRLAGELKAAGDKPGAAKLAKLARPPISAWVVDQLWWRHRAAFDALLETAQRLRDGKLDAMAAHREAIAKLRAHAAHVLADAEHGATEATLRRVTQTLSALAATGGWEPDLPGALSADRDPPGFEAIGVSNLLAFPAADAPKHDATSAHPTRAQAAPTHAAHAKPAHAAHAAPAHAAHAKPAHAVDDHDDLARKRRDAAEAKRRAEHEAAAARAEAAAEQRRLEAARAKATAERHRLEAALRTAHGDVTSRERDVARLERELASARHHVTQAKAVVEGLEERLGQLE
jgi:hypothetical protein